MNDSSNKNNHLLLFLCDDCTEDTSFQLTEGIYFIGRHSNNSIRLNSPSVSRHHATLMRRDSANGESIYILIDGDLEGKRSQNGTLVNGKKIIHHSLRDGDLIAFGSNDNQAVYKQEVSDNIIIYPYCDLNSKKSKSESLTSSNLAREKLQDTLIVSELNLKNSLENYDIQRLASFPELSPNPILEFDFSGNIIYCNPSAKLNFEDLLKQTNQENPLIKDLKPVSEENHGELIIREIEIEDKHYEQYIHYLSKENVIRSYIFDITERKNSEAKLKYHALHDSLTGIPNRDFFYWQISKNIQEAKESLCSTFFAVLFIDIDRFKNINDTLSHSIGDKLLESFTHRLVSVIPSDYFVARWGGDEFILITPLEIINHKDSGKITKKTSAQVVAEKIINVLKESFSIEKYTIFTTCSIGIAIYPEDGNDEQHLIKNADIALYRAKQMGRNNYQFYTNTLNKEKTLLFELENSLYNSLENKELFLTYQPQLNLKTNTLEGVEVLLRWQHPVLGVVSPSKFIPLAEETGLIISIGEWVLEMACEEGTRWLDLGYPPIMIAVNVSGKQFQQDNFADKVKEILIKTQFNPEYLEIEITESILMQDSEKTETIIKELSGLGVKFSLDDFGTGYSSLSYLKKFPFNFIKIDKSFVTDLVTNFQDQALVSAIITLAKGYNMKVVAEGVEVETQKTILKNFRCDLIQGWLVSEPLIREDFMDFMASYRQKTIND
ncbi:EAL domain-containing protein [Cyanobacterium aponinum FACHB-4101]|uniref:EAL domain-containing protein n=1 Tax=Cyanobacterium aponinum TaxID=379064 RepID=UPI0016813C68|nr:EAL domain-containing protein [Cyanobacterium aponinum]MBD2394777.1 EAL domain-containing protein [Cyanobacterium aponinum FACHB-4101]